MARPNVEFINAYEMNPARTMLPGFSSDLSVRSLSEDAETGARTLMVDYPAGFTLPAGYFACDRETFVIDGHLRMGGKKLGRWGYQFQPAGQMQEPMSAPKGARVLEMFEAAPTFVPSTTSSPSPSDEEMLFLNLDSVPYQAPTTPGVQPGLAVKVLRTNPRTGGRTWFSGSLPGFSIAAVEVRPVAEESFRILGRAYLHGKGVMGPGTYIWRLPSVEHCPARILDPTITFARTDGPLQPTYFNPFTGAIPWESDDWEDT